MFTRTLTPSAIATALLLGVFSHQAAATEEIVVYGAEAVAQIEARQAMFHSELVEYKRSVNEWIKATLQDGVRLAAAPRLKLAGNEEADNEEIVRG